MQKDVKETVNEREEKVRMETGGERDKKRNR